VPAGGSPPAICKERYLLAGDAAGQVMATSGGAYLLLSSAAGSRARWQQPICKEGSH